MKMTCKASPFFPDPLGDYRPKPNFPFDDDFQDEPEFHNICGHCIKPLLDHSKDDLINCAFEIALVTVKGGKKE